MTQRDEEPTQGTHTGDPYRGDPHRGPTQGTRIGAHRDPHTGEGPTAEDPPPEGRATQKWQNIRCSKIDVLNCVF